MNNPTSKSSKYIVAYSPRLTCPHQNEQNNPTS